jgi:hypothetical protein
VTLAVKDFTVTANLATISTNVGTSIADTVVVKGLNGFIGNVALTCSIVGAPAGMGCSLSNPNPAASSTGTSVTATVTSNASTTPAGTYTVQVTGTASGQSKSVSFTVNVKDFTLGVNPSSQSIATAGGALNYTSTLTALNGFNSSVTLSCQTPLPAGITCAFGPTNTTTLSVVPAALGTTSNVRISVANGTLSNAYAVTVKSASGGITRTQVITVDVTP